MGIMSFPTHHGRPLQKDHLKMFSTVFMFPFSDRTERVSHSDFLHPNSHPLSVTLSARSLSRDSSPPTAKTDGEARHVLLGSLSVFEDL